MAVTPLVALHLIPGAVAAVVYWSLIGPMEAAGFPPLTALLAAIILVILPLELGVLAIASRRQGSPSRVFGAITFVAPLPRRLSWRLVPFLIVAGIAASAVGVLIEGPLQQLLGRWVPEWLVAVVDANTIGAFETSAWIVTMVLYVVVNIILGPVVEELYFRGYLLPRMQRFGRWAPLLNTALFSLYHFWSPAQLVSRIGGAAPYVYAVERNRNIYLGMVVHIALNAISVATLLVIIF